MNSLVVLYAIQHFKTMSLCVVIMKNGHRMFSSYAPSSPNCDDRLTLLLFKNHYTCVVLSQIITVGQYN